MALRINRRQVTREAYLQKCSGLAIAARPGTLSPQAMYLEKPRDVADLPGFFEGEVSVQDEAAQLAAQLLQAEPGERILDACAAPGGKTCHLLELQPELAEMVAMDVDPTRLSKVDENLQRLQLQATVVRGDASAPGPELTARPFDKILVDAPCSATGVIRRHPDVKLLRRAADIKQLADLQFRILQGLWPLLKPGGLLLYVTCSVLSEENGSVVERFLGHRRDAETRPIDDNWGERAGPGRQLLPTAGSHDGLFYCLLQRLG
jgi:16S rRNA (cytosine967-C5)-methyltransferase